MEALEHHLLRLQLLLALAEKHHLLMPFGNPYSLKWRQHRL
jgi:hypothetical protein